MKKQLWKNILMYCLVISLVLSNCSTTSIFAATTNDTKRNASSEATEPIDDAKECSGSGTLESPYIIKNAVQLSSIANNLTAYYQLGCDID